ncbi:hypothetical protein G436_1177 [Leptospira interrogans serovar Hardjo str. Norma]|uniref:Uncharacterized protein n=1 Tax=Leptospira interrogans serovar Hardjo str. Norma TaxID=1279460 RepID=A0A0M4MSC2_LEPIR|nr:hypothetical protein G436_1177 [Leptospira interrogans serovar Hardjo str. Norma]
MLLKFYLLELLKNSIVTVNKTASIAGFHKIETDGELIFQQFYL